MQNWLLIENIVATAALLAATTVIVVAFIKTSKFIKRIVHFFDDFLGEEERPGVAPRPGFSERMSHIEKQLNEGTEKFSIIENKLDRIDYELRPNSGLSLRDAVNRIEKRIDQVESEVNGARN